MGNERPFFQDKGTQVVKAGQVAFKAGDAERLQEAITELREHRSKRWSIPAAEELEGLLAEMLNAKESRWTLELDGPMPPDDWLDSVAEVASQFQAKEEGVSSVYLALLAGLDDADFGIYVGKTNLEPSVRYANHKRGHKASRWVTKYGIGLLSPMFEHLVEISYDEAGDLEGSVADALWEAGISVRGGH